MVFSCIKHDPTLGRFQMCKDYLYRYLFNLIKCLETFTTKKAAVLYIGTNPEQILWSMWRLNRGQIQIPGGHEAAPWISFAGVLLAASHLPQTLACQQYQRIIAFSKFVYSAAKPMRVRLASSRLPETTNESPPCILSHSWNNQWESALHPLTFLKHLLKIDQ